MIDFGNEVTTIPELERDGAPVKMSNGTILFLRPWLGPEHRAALDRMKERYAHLAEKDGTLPKAENEEVGIRAIVEGVLVGWQGARELVTRAEIGYSPEAAYDALKASPRLQTFVIQKSSDIATFQQGLEKIRGEGSAPSSAGNSTGAPAENSSTISGPTTA